MSFWSAAVLIVAMVMIASVLRSRHGGARHHINHDGGEASARERELQREVEELRERVKVLERITTDGRQAKAIAEEIESLRDK